VTPHQLADDAGVHTFRAEVGEHPPATLGSVPSLEGFTLCRISTTFHDDEWGGPYFDFVAGEYC
jgi:hypothetical protein